MTMNRACRVPPRRKLVSLAVSLPTLLIQQAKLDLGDSDTSVLCHRGECILQVYIWNSTAAKHRDTTLL